MDIDQFEARKRDHIQFSLNPSHQATGLSGLEQVHLVHEALPDLDFSEVDLRSTCLGRKLATPFFVAGMTAGHPDAFEVNRTLALACQKRGWAMGVGSQRRALEESQLQLGLPNILDEGQELRRVAPDLVLFANLGISQLIYADINKVKEIVKRIDAAALVIHLNALQEVIQPEGTPFFKGCDQTIRKFSKELGIPVVVKETGCGFSIKTLERLVQMGIAAVDVSGLGGTHWGRIEGARAKAASSHVHTQAAITFADWGESTTESVMSATRVCASTEIWASGGVRSGLDAAKLLAIGAHRVGYAKPALEEALKGSEALQLWMETQEYELKVALFCTGTRNTEELRRKDGVWKIKGR